LLDRFDRDLSYILHLLIGLLLFNSLPIDHGRRLVAKNGVRAFAIVQLSLTTPTIPPSAEFCTTTIPGLVAMSASIVSLRSRVLPLLAAG
jgi:hypothetical protein